MIDWRTKLTSRKFWAAIAEFVTMLIVAFHGTQETAAQVAAIIMAGAAVVAYIIGEGLADAAGAANAVNLVPYDDDDAEYDADDPPDKWGKSGLFHGTSGDTDEDDLK